MGRPAKPVKTMARHNTKKEVQNRQENEKLLKGGSDKIQPPKYLNKRQKDIFNYIVNELSTSQLLGNLDIYILATCSIAIIRLQDIEKMINKDSLLLYNTAFLGTKDKYTKDLYRCCTELGLSPQGRAKMANGKVLAEKEKEDPVLKALRGGRGD